jgi:release factor glutamine methyltransferase
MNTATFYSLSCAGEIKRKDREILMAKSAIHELRRTEPSLFRRVFWLGESVPFSKQLKGLVDLGLVKRQGRHAKSSVQISICRGQIVITDRLDYRFPDRVFPIFSDEGMLLSAVAKQVMARRVLDVGTGSGILGLQSAMEGSVTLATDVNPRALCFAQVNALINGLDKRVQFCESDVYRAVPEQSYDLIVSNPPFAPVPVHSGFHVAGNGGSDGTRVIRRILSGAAERLHCRGVLLMTALSLCLRSGPLISKIAGQAMKGCAVHSYSIYRDKLRLDEYCSAFANCNGYHQWRSYLHKRGVESIDYVLLSVSRNAPVVLRLPWIPRTRFSGSWSGRLNRYRYWNQISQ